eukprot:TRINITY_DN4165_c0_g1_i1.p1 TRINITY_DN4165_c0_g1~~TRINITY_DN4165_c0_g1_i1.p1  ORF type:complete len:322 (+),score=48.42 TRINITY_DN4165_c0_g1_i1:1002-1967(+)
MSTSSPGSSQCRYCPLNTVYDEASETCTSCKSSEFAYPGDKACRRRTMCKSEYDVVASYSKCVDGKRKVEYSVRSGSLCDVKGIFVPSSKKDIECKACPMGTYIEANSERKCTKCLDGEYSAEHNAKSCSVCSEGYYAPKSLAFERMEEMPEEATTACEHGEEAQANLCAVHEGWTVYNGSFRVPSYLPQGIVLILRLPVETKGNAGRVEFVYKLGGSEEELKVAIDGISKNLASNSLKTVSFDLTEGKHTIEWIYKRAGDLDTETQAAIHSIIVTGAPEGSARKCIKCPNSFTSTKGSSDCTKCPLGMISNNDSNSLITL